MAAVAHNTPICTIDPVYAGTYRVIVRGHRAFSGVDVAESDSGGNPGGSISGENLEYDESGTMSPPYH